MNNKFFMGIDIGTYSSKGVIVDEKGQVICRASVPHGMENPKPGYYEHDAEAVWWHDFCVLSQELLEKSGLNGNQITAVGASALGSDCLPVDEECRPLRKAILYGIDARSVEEIRELTKYYGEQRIKELFGRAMVSGDVAAKILWVRKNEPEVFAKTYKFLTGSSYLTAKLTGNYVIDRFLGIASFRPFYDMDGNIQEDFCEPVCRPDQLANGQAVTDLAGYVTLKASKETGLAAGIPVITGTGDSAAEAVSIGVLMPDDLMVQFGSSLFFYCCTDRMIRDDRVRGNTFLIPGTYSVAAGTNNGGTLQNWYCDQMFPDAIKNEEISGESPFQFMMRGMEKIAPGCEGLITIPYFAGERTPINDPEARGLIIGLSPLHTRAHLYRSALEGIGYGVAQHIDIFRENQLYPERILAAGGGTKNLVWMQMIADITGLPVHIMEETIGAAYGDALMAAIGIGHFEHFQALRDVIRLQTVLMPDQKRHEAYLPYYEMFAGLYEKNKIAMHKLAGFQMQKM